MKKQYIILLLATYLSLFFNVHAKDTEKNELINLVQKNLILNYFSQSESFQESALKIKEQMTNKMLKSYTLNELKELKVISEDKTFLSVNSKFENQDIKIEDILLKNSATELSKLDKNKQQSVLAIKKTLSLDKYSKLATQIMEKKLAEKLPDSLPSFAIDSMKDGLKKQAQDGLMATFYQQLAQVELKDLNHYQQSIKKKSFIRYYNQVMDLTYTELNK